MSCKVFWFCLLAFEIDSGSTHTLKVYLSVSGGGADIVLGALSWKCFEVL